MSSVNVENLLYEAIGNDFEHVNAKELGSDERKAAFNELTALLDRAIEMDKLESEREDRAETRESEQALKEQQLEEDKKDRLIKNIVSAAGVVLPILVTIWGTKVSLKFEETGSFTTIMGRGFINKLLPKK